ncbi:hypothetical protein BC830DRAFT_534871 [Chytriomyces sp. MP71]|nr:hypothetical protein BC830DRAFT_534871 [Chytriomyces sp. MP71]
METSTLSATGLSPGDLDRLELELARDISALMQSDADADDGDSDVFRSFGGGDSFSFGDADVDSIAVLSASSPQLSFASSFRLADAPPQQPPQPHQQLQQQHQQEQHLLHNFGANSIPKMANPPPLPPKLVHQTPTPRASASAVLFSPHQQHADPPPSVYSSASSRFSLSPTRSPLGAQNRVEETRNSVQIRLALPSSNKTATRSFSVNDAPLQPASIQSSANNLFYSTSNVSSPSAAVKSVPSSASIALSQRLLQYSSLASNGVLRNSQTPPHLKMVTTNGSQKSMGPDSFSSKASSLHVLSGVGLNLHSSRPPSASKLTPSDTTSGFGINILSSHSPAGSGVELRTSHSPSTIKSFHVGRSGTELHPSYLPSAPSSNLQTGSKSNVRSSRSPSEPPSKTVHVASGSGLELRPARSPSASPIKSSSKVSSGIDILSLRGASNMTNKSETGSRIVLLSSRSPSAIKSSQMVSSEIESQSLSALPSNSHGGSKMDISSSRLPPKTPSKPYRASDDSGTEFRPMRSPSAYPAESSQVFSESGMDLRKLRSPSAPPKSPRISPLAKYALNASSLMMQESEALSGSNRSIKPTEDDGSHKPASYTSQAQLNASKTRFKSVSVTPANVFNGVKATPKSSSYCSLKTAASFDGGSHSASSTSAISEIRRPLFLDTNLGCLQTGPLQTEASSSAAVIIKSHKSSHQDHHQSHSQTQPERNQQKSMSDSGPSQDIASVLLHQQHSKAGTPVSSSGVSRQSQPPPFVNQDAMRTKATTYNVTSSNQRISAQSKMDNPVSTFGILRQALQQSQSVNAHMDFTPNQNVSIAVPNRQVSGTPVSGTLVELSPRRNMSVLPEPVYEVDANQSHGTDYVSLGGTGRSSPQRSQSVGPQDSGRTSLQRSQSAAPNETGSMSNQRPQSAALNSGRNSPQFSRSGLILGSNSTTPKRLSSSNGSLGIPASGKAPHSGLSNTDLYARMNPPPNNFVASANDLAAFQTANVFSTDRQASSSAELNTHPAYISPRMKATTSFGSRFNFGVSSHPAREPSSHSCLDLGSKKIDAFLNSQGGGSMSHAFEEDISGRLEKIIAAEIANVEKIVEDSDKRNQSQNFHQNSAVQHSAAPSNIQGVFMKSNDSRSTSRSPSRERLATRELFSFVTGRTNVPASAGHQKSGSIPRLPSRDALSANAGGISEPPQQGNSLLNRTKSNSLSPSRPTLSPDYDHRLYSPTKSQQYGMVGGFAAPRASALLGKRSSMPNMMENGYGGTHKPVEEKQMPESQTPQNRRKAPSQESPRGRVRPGHSNSSSPVTRGGERSRSPLSTVVGIEDTSEPEYFEKTSPIPAEKASNYGNVSSYMMGSQREIQLPPRAPVRDERDTSHNRARGPRCFLQVHFMVRTIHLLPILFLPLPIWPNCRIRRQKVQA